MIKSDSNGEAPKKKLATVEKLFLKENETLQAVGALMFCGMFCKCVQRITFLFFLGFPYAYAHVGITFPYVFFIDSKKYGL